MKQRGFFDLAPLVTLAVVVGAGLLIGKQAREIEVLKRSTSDMADAVRARDTAEANFEKAVRSFERTIATEVAKQEEKDRAQIEDLRRAAGTERAKRLRADATLADRTRELQNLARRAATDAEREASATAIGVFADVLGRADERAGILAAAADEGRARGNACERQYDTVAARINTGMPHSED